MNKIQKIKEIVAKIDIDKIVTYSQEYPKSKTLRQIIRCKERVLESNDEKKVFKLSTDLAYYLDLICDEKKGNYVKNEKEKKYWLEISKELFTNTIGVKVIKI